jgi:hypothetical protein
MNDSIRLALIAEAVRYCQHVKTLGMPPSCYTKALREPIHFLWERRAGSKSRCAKFRSKAAVGLQFGGGDLVYDHAVPFNYLQDELLSLSPVTEQAVARTLEKYGTIVLVTRAEDSRLSGAGYRGKMPPGWDGTDPLARYNALGIELVQNKGD